MEYIDIKKGYTKEDIKKISESIRLGRIIILPTDTVYGISASPFNEKAIKKVYDLKERDLSKPCNILVSNFSMIKDVTKNITKIEERIIKEFFPGALTIIFDKNDKIPKSVTAGLDTIGIRMPDNKFLLELIENIGHPILATSLNISGEKAEINVSNLPKKIKENVDLIVDAGDAKIKKASTIIRVEENKIKILREGPITKEEIEDRIKEGRKTC